MLTEKLESKGEEPLSLETNGGGGWTERFVLRVKNKASGNSWGIK